MPTSRTGMAATDPIADIHGEHKIEEWLTIK